MIIIKYIVQYTIKIQLIILIILFSILLSLKLIKILNSVLEGFISINIGFCLLFLGATDIAQLIIPLSLFLGLLFTLGKLYTDSEIIVMQACGMSTSVLVKAAMILALFTAIFAAINVMFIGPWSSKYHNKVLAEAKGNPSLAGLKPGQFQHTGSYVLFINSFAGSILKDVFIANNIGDNYRKSIVVADYGKLSQRKDGSKIVTLNKGTQLEVTVMQRDFRITDFNMYQAIIDSKNIFIDHKENPEHMNIHTLWNSDNNSARAELHWRITMIITVFIMALIVVPLSMVNLRKDSLISIMPAILLYLLFFLMHTLIKSNYSFFNIDPFLLSLLVNLAYLLFAIVLNFWDTGPVLRIREFLKNSV